MDLDVDRCYPCHLNANPELATVIKERAEKLAADMKAQTDARNAKARAAKRRHPCRLRTVTGKCQKSMIGSQCPYSPTKAPKMCGDIVLKKAVKNVS